MGVVTVYRNKHVCKTLEAAIETGMYQLKVRRVLNEASIKVATTDILIRASQTMEVVWDKYLTIFLRFTGIGFI